MFDDLEILGLSQSMARHAALRQNIIAQNVANADTPGYRARDVEAFTDLYDRTAGSEGTAMRATRAGHFSSAQDASPEVSTAVSDATSPNGNSVSLEDEMVKSVETKRQYDLSLTIYKSALGILRSSIGKA